MLKKLLAPKRNPDVSHLTLGEVASAWAKRKIKKLLRRKGNTEHRAAPLSAPSLPGLPVFGRTQGERLLQRKTVHVIAAGQGEEASGSVLDLCAALHVLGVPGNLYCDPNCKTFSNLRPVLPIDQLPAHDDFVLICHFAGAGELPHDLPPLSAPILLAIDEPPGDTGRSLLRNERLRAFARQAFAGLARNGDECLTLNGLGVRLNFDVGSDMGQLDLALAASGVYLCGLTPQAPSAEEGSLEFSGHINGSYSLARITRAHALGAESVLPGRIRLISIEGDARGRLDNVPEPVAEAIHVLAGRTQVMPRPIIGVTHHWPPIAPADPTDLSLVLFPWEEGRAPPEVVAMLEKAGDAILATSTFVEKALIDSGVARPVFNQLQAPDLQPFFALQAERRWPRVEGKFRFLHVSSCFQRKGVDVLLNAYASAFKPTDAVELVIKGFPNPHNDVDDQIAALRARAPQLAPLVFINQDMDDDAILQLYATADAVVLPTRGEGFNMPAAEAAAAKIPVIVTAASGHMDFLDEETAELVDYSFRPSQSHVAAATSVWLEPDADDLARRMRAVFERAQSEAGRTFMEARLDRAEASIKAKLSIDSWVGATLRNADLLLRNPPPPARTRVAWVSTWRAPCGLAEYSRFLLDHFDPELFDVCVFGDQRTPDHADIVKAVRHSTRSWSHSAEGWLEHIGLVARYDPDVVIFQHHWGLYGPHDFDRLVQHPSLDRAAIIVVLHNTRDMDGFKPEDLECMMNAFRRSTRLLVHSIDDLNRLKRYGFADKAVYFPHGVLFDNTQAALPASPGGRIIGSYGFIMPHKGVSALIEALPSIQAKIPGARLRLVNALFSNDASVQELERCQKLVTRLGLSDSVEFHTDYLENEESLQLLRGCDAIVFPYQETSEAASGAVRLALGANRPIATTPIQIFEELGSGRFVLPGASSDDIARGLIDLLSDPNLCGSVLDRQRAWSEARSWRIMARQLMGLLRSVNIQTYYRRRAA